MSVMITYTNKFFDIASIQDSDQLDIEDIAHSLSNKCRFNGHCQKFYSVAEHSILCSRLAPEWLKLNALMHDASEALLGDITGPVKQHFYHVFGPIERQLNDYIIQVFSLPILNEGDKGIIKHIDKSLLLHEAYTLFDNPFSDDRFIWPDPEQVSKPDVDILCLSPDKAKDLFLDEFGDLSNRQRLAAQEVVSLLVDNFL